MTEDGRGQPVVVDLAECRCPGTPHQPGDTVTLRAEPSVPMGTAAWAVASLGGKLWDIQARLAEVWLAYGIVDWSFLDAKGQPEPVTPANIDRLLPFSGGGMEVAEAADDLYSDPVLSPLAARRSKLSPPTPTEASTSPSPPSGDGSPTPSSPSPRPARRGKRSEVPVP